MRKMILCLLVSCFSMSSLFSADFQPGFVAEVVTDQLTEPTSIAVAPDGRIFITEKGGDIRIIENGVLLPDPFVSLPVDVYGERGLGSILMDPDFDSNGYIYVYYNVELGDHNRISRLTANGNSAIPGSEFILMELGELASTIHNGGGMRFGLDGKLYVAVGDGAIPHTAQSMNSTFGKMLRLNKDGSIPTDNPFYSTTTGDNRAIYAVGLRNPYSFDIDPLSGRIMANDVGAEDWEEVNEILSGQNYGWATVEGPLTTQTPPQNYQDPVYAYDHSQGCAVVGGAMYNYPNSNYPAEIQNHYLFSEYCRGEIYMLDLATNQVTDTFATRVNFLTSMLVDPNTGNLLYCELVTGKLWRVLYLGTGAPFVSEHPKDVLISVGEDTEFNCVAVASGTISYQWYRDGQPVSGATSASLSLTSPALSDSGATFQCMVYNGPDTAWSDPAVLGVTSNQRPVLTITNPLGNQVYTAGDMVVFEGSATDPETGPIDDQSRFWTVDFHHDEHVHPFLPRTAGTGGNFMVPFIGETDTNVWFRIHQTAYDPQGMEANVYVDVHPSVGSFQLRTSPPGMEVTQEGSFVTTPATFSGVPGMTRVATAPLLNIHNDSLFRFLDWDGSSNDTLEIAIPSIHGIYTANYEFVAPYIEGEGDGLWGQYWDGAEQQGIPVHEQVDATINFNFGWGGPVHVPTPAAVAMGGDSFSIRWTGDLLAPTTGNYTFYLSANEIGRLYFDNVLQIDAWTRTGNTVDTLELFLVAGVRYPIQVDYAEAMWQSKVLFEWDPPYFDREILPQSQLFSASGSGSQPPLAESLIFPNPLTDQAYVYLSDLPGSDLVPVTVTIYDAMGRKMQVSTVDMNTGNPGLLDLSKLASQQIYIFEITYEDTSVYLRTLKLK